MTKYQKYVRFEGDRQLYGISRFFAEDVGIRQKTLAERARGCKPNSRGYLYAKKVMYGKKELWYYRIDQKDKLKSIGKSENNAPRFMKEWDNDEEETYENIGYVASETGIKRGTLQWRIKHSCIKGKKFRVGLKRFWYINIKEKEEIAKTSQISPPEFLGINGEPHQILTKFSEGDRKKRARFKYRLETCKPGDRCYIKGKKVIFGLCEYWYVAVSEKDKEIKRREASKPGKRIRRKKQKRLKKTVTREGRLEFIKKRYAKKIAAEMRERKSREKKQKILTEILEEMETAEDGPAREADVIEEEDILDSYKG